MVTKWDIYAEDRQENKKYALESYSLDEAFLFLKIIYYLYI